MSILTLDFNFGITQFPQDRKQATEAVSERCGSLLALEATALPALDTQPQLSKDRAAADRLTISTVIEQHYVGV